MNATDFQGRKAPYAPVSAMREFFHRTRDVSIPPRVDQGFLKKLSIAAGNEWALLSALKFLGIIDDAGTPTAAYRRLLDASRFEQVLKDLLRQAYAPLLNDGGASMTQAELENYFRVASSPSQARNATRFFRALSVMAGGLGSPDHGVEQKDRVPDPGEERGFPSHPQVGKTHRELLDVKIRLLEKLPPPNPDWSPEDYLAVYDRFIQLLDRLDD